MPHLVVLPPPNDGSALLLCRRGDYGAPCTFINAQAFLWNSSDPTNVEFTITLPQTAGGVSDPFCSGHAPTSGPEHVFYGGTDHVADCLDGSGPDLPWGHSVAWIFDNVEYIRNQSAPQFYSNPVPMARARWYPTAMQRGDNSTVVFGHFGNPPAPLPPQPGDVETRYTRERATWSEATDVLTWLPTMHDFINYKLPCSPLPAPFQLGDYPRVHQLASGLAIVLRQVGLVLDFDQCQGADENERFLLLDSSGPNQPQLESNTTVHYVDLRNPQGNVDEWIVSIAGADEEAGCDGPGADLLVESDDVVYMLDPAPAKAWDSLPSLQLSRTEANAVVGLNGEIVVFGGYGHNLAGAIVARMSPELFRPSFLFGPTLASADWSLLASMTHPHAYHSVAGLLEDGRMLVAGGNLACPDPGGPLDSGAHAVEIFSPPGLFGGGRPRIDGVFFLGQPVTELEYSPDPAATFSIDVLLHGGNSGEFRVALTRPASVTHAFDNNQRYVVLRVNTTLSQFVSPPSNSNLVVHLPTDLQTNAVPPGYYLLTVVNAAGRPAAAKWIRMKPL